MASVRERVTSSGEKTWAVLYRHGGKQTSATFDHPKDANRFKELVNLLGPDKALKEHFGADVGGLTLDELFERWIDWKAGTGVTSRTLKDYRRDYDNWIRDRLGHRQADSIDELDVQEWVDWMTKRKADPKSIGDRHMILSGIYRFGVARSRRLVDHNPCAETSLPSKRRKAPKGFTLAQWAAMHAWAVEHEPDAADLLLFLASTGWRFSEATPVTPAAIEDHGDILVDGVAIPEVYVAVRGVHRLDENYRVVYVEGEAKSRAGVRRINLPPAAARMVRRRMVGRGVNELLFTNARGKRWHSTNFIEREFQRILDGAGITKVKGMGPHYLRHTHVAMLDRAKVSLAKTQRRIGHENISTTLGVYGGMIDNTLEPAELVRLDALVAQPDSAFPAAGAVVAGEVVTTVRGELG